MAETGQERLLGGRYRVLRQLSRGTFGDTYLAEDTHRFQELCVLKEFNPQVPGKLAVDKAQSLFEREASILYQINHPQVPRFRELLRDETRLFLAQDYVEGPTYRELLSRRLAYSESFSEAEVVQFLMQTLPLLQYLHSIGIVHRDISPDNLIQRNADGRPMLIDFGGVKQLVVNVRHQLGVAQPYQAADGTVTRLGTVGYAPEEQLASGQVSPATDLYGLGMTALVLLTGKEPEDLYDNHRDRWLWPEQVEVSATLTEVLSRLVAHDPGDRYPSAGQAMAALNLAHPDRLSAAWSQPMPIRMQPMVPPPPKPVMPEPTQAVAPAAPRYPMPYDPTATVAPPPRAVPVQKTSSGCWPALAGLLVTVGVAGGLWWWLDPLSQFAGNGPEAVSPGGSDAENPALNQAERDRKQALRDRAAALSVDQSYLTALTDQLFYEQNPSLQGTQLTDQPEDEPLRTQWDGIANTNLDRLEANLSTEARSRLGRYNPTDSDRWQRQVNARFVSSRALNDLADARFDQLFPGRETNSGFVDTPVDQIWFGLAQDQVNAMERGENLSEITFEPGAFNQQRSGNLNPGQGQIYLLNLSAEQLLRLNLQAPPGSTRLSLYVPVPTDELPYILADAEQNTWAGDLPQSGYYEVVVVSQGSTPIPYSLTVAVDNVTNDIINRPDPPAKEN